MLEHVVFHGQEIAPWEWKTGAEYRKEWAKGDPDLITDIISERDPQQT
jgi:hypothetical protein